MISFSEQGQDLFAFEHTKKNTGTFLDVGCWHPTHNNNTYGLEIQGWRGVLIDVDVQWAAPCKLHRSNPFVRDNAMLIDWAALVQQYELGRHIDYLSLDVDDKAEDKPFSKTREVLGMMMSAGLVFGAITVEHDAYRLGDEPRASIREMLSEAGYSLFRENISCRPPDPSWAFEDWFVKGENK